MEWKGNGWNGIEMNGNDEKTTYKGMERNRKEWIGRKGMDMNIGTISQNVLHIFNYFYVINNLKRILTF